jgi:putative transposase
MDIPGLPRHLVVRGNNRMPCFTNDMDRRVFLRYLGEALVEYGCRLHAFVLMTNHVHLLVTGDREGAIASMMHSVGLRYVRYFNTAHDRTGSLFEGRYRASHVEDERYLLTCMRYIELNPVRAGIVVDPADYPWSSYRHNAGLETRPEITFHEEFLRVGSGRLERAAAWVDLVREGLTRAELDRLRRTLNRNRPLGSADFEHRLRVVTMGSGSRT